MKNLRKKNSWLLATAISTAALGLTACNSDDDDDDPIFDQQVKLLLADDQGDNVGSISQYQFSSNNGEGTASKIINAELAEGIVTDALGNVYQAGNLSTGEGAIRAMCRPTMRTSPVMVSDNQDRLMTSAMSSPKGIALAQDAGYMMVAQSGDDEDAVTVFGSSAGDATSPVFTIPLAMVNDAGAWDVVYDEATDRLYVAATNGTIQVYDDYMADPSEAPERIIDPNDSSGFEASNIHGIVHDSATNRLIVSDVGSATVADDGRIYVIDNADTADGPWDLRLELAGNLTALGNPVDLAFDGENLYVAEKSNNQLQRIDDIYSLSGVLNRAPDSMMTFTAPESIAIAPE